jgi:hypothetical protein
MKYLSIINGSDLLMRWLNLFSAFQHLSSGTNLNECENHSWFEVQAVPVFWYTPWNVFVYPGGCAYPILKTTVLDNQLTDGGEVAGRPPVLYPPERFLALTSVRGWVDVKVIVRLGSRHVLGASRMLRVLLIMKSRTFRAASHPWIRFSRTR